MPSKAPLFDDGVHFVRGATKSDKHPLRFVVTAHRAADSKRKRHVGTLPEAIEVAKLYTEAAAAESQKDATLAEAKRLADNPPTPSQPVAPPPPVDLAAMSEDEFHRRTQAEPKPATKKAKGPPAFSSSYFTCKVANPAAQVWECTSLQGERKVGRPKAGKKSTNAAEFKHQKGECAVVQGKEPIRDPDGHIRVYRNWLEANEHATALYETAYENGEVITWRPGDIVVERFTDVEICFDPEQSATRPFYLLINQKGYRKPYYRTYTSRQYNHGARNMDGSSYVPENDDAKAAHDLNRRLDKMFNEEFRSTGLSQAIARWRTMWEAEAMALKLERTYCGNEDLYP